MVFSLKALLLYAGILATPLAEAFPKLSPAFNLSVCFRLAHPTRTAPCACVCGLLHSCRLMQLFSDGGWKCYSDWIFEQGNGAY